MTRQNNIDAYIERKVQRELDKNLSKIAERKLKQLNASSTISNTLRKHQRNSFTEFGKSLYRTHFAEFNLLGEFGTSGSQFMNIFISEIKRALFRSF